MGQSDGELEEIGLENKGQEKTCPKDAANRFKLCFVYVMWICHHKRALSPHKRAQDETINSSLTSHTNISDLMSHRNEAARNCKVDKLCGVTRPIINKKYRNKILS